MSWDWEKLKKEQQGKAEEEAKGYQGQPVLTPGAEWGTEVGEWLWGCICRASRVVLILTMISVVGFFFTLGAFVAQWAFAAL